MGIHSLDFGVVLSTSAYRHNTFNVPPGIEWLRRVVEGWFHGGRPQAKAPSESPRKAGGSKERVVDLSLLGGSSQDLDTWLVTMVIVVVP